MTKGSSKLGGGNSKAPTNEGEILGGEYGYFTEKGIDQLEQLGAAKAMEERIEVIKDLIEKDKRVKRGDKGKRDDIDIVLVR